LINPILRLEPGSKGEVEAPDEGSEYCASLVQSQRSANTIGWSFG
jgi:hypothetical protein